MICYIIMASMRSLPQSLLSLYQLSGNKTREIITFWWSQGGIVHINHRKLFVCSEIFCEIDTENILVFYLYMWIYLCVYVCVCFFHLRGIFVKLKNFSFLILDIFVLREFRISRFGILNAVCIFTKMISFQQGFFYKQIFCRNNFFY